MDRHTTNNTPPTVGWRRNTHGPDESVTIDDRVVWHRPGHPDVDLTAATAEDLAGEWEPVYRPGGES